LVVGIAEAAERQGAVIRTGVGVRTLIQTPAGWRIETTAGIVECAYLVIASNAWTGQLCPGLAKAITPVRAQALATAPVAPGLIRGALATNYGYEYWRQMPNGQVLLGGKRWTEADQALNTFDPAPQPTTHARLVEFLHAHYPALREVLITHSWGGLMAFNKDGLPYIGPLPGMANAWVAACYNGHGMAFGYSAGQAISDLIVDTGTGLDIARFAIDWTIRR
ncbi:MAG: FAD-binding oxidoreductase, partial [bacterium]